MKQAFRHDKITNKRADQIQLINEILEEYDQQGYVLTLRQLYYQLVGRGIIANEVREYTKVMKTLTMGRMNGLIDWDMIEDRSRRPHMDYAVLGISDALQDTLNQYKLDRQAGQECNIEIWTEKDAVSNILMRVSRYYHLRLSINRGYTSCSAMYIAAARIRRQKVVRDRSTKILYVGDHDPSGLDMVRDIVARFFEFEIAHAVEIIPVALTKEQIEEYNPPPNPAKINDPRASQYMFEHGDESWELDALEPEVLRSITEEVVKEHLNQEIFDDVLSQEEIDKIKLEELITDDL